MASERCCAMLVNYSLKAALTLSNECRPNGNRLNAPAYHVLGEEAAPQLAACATFRGPSISASQVQATMF